MINVKIIVLFVFIIIDISCTKYCEICPNHVLCKFPVPGPSAACKGYNVSALLTEVDISDIVNRINERRNFVAMGYSRTLPQAANMRKITWSVELAAFAQRWVDQCDPSMRPNKHDQCRDLEHTPVGQNIATIWGPCPGLNVKSLVDTWFTQSLDYTGSVLYYNQSRDTKTAYLTQLVWANTDAVGCGKARFLSGYNNVVMERLVCNFAPKGNNHGQPVFAIGLAATQCPEDMEPDEKFIGLCSYHGIGKKNASNSPPVTSILRILSLSHNIEKQEIDPIKSNLKQIKSGVNETSDQRNQKIRHVFLNHTFGRQYDPPQHHWNNPMSPSNNYGVHGYQHERGHSRVYHGHAHGDNSVTLSEEGGTQDLTKYDYSTESLNSYANSNLRRFNHHVECTRRFISTNNDCASSECDKCNKCVTDRCTRGQMIHGCRQATEPCCDSTTTIPPLLTNECQHQDSCSCNAHRSTCPTTTGYNSNVKCQCPHMKINNHCPKIVRIEDDVIKDETRKSADLHYYDLYPNIPVGIRSGEVLENKPSPMSDIFSNRNPWLLKNTAHVNHPKMRTVSHKRKEFFHNNRQVKDSLGYPKYFDEDRDYTYGSFDSSERQRREPEDMMTFRPFWQMDEYSLKNPSQLKSLRYTTLGNKRNKNTLRTNIITEPITFNVRDLNIHDMHGDHVTDKYLSFEELMHLRKNNVDDFDARRQNKQTTKTTTKITPTTKPTTNPTTKPTTKPTIKTTTKAATTTKKTVPTTRFPVRKECSRKITCTWTMATMTGIDGNILDPNANRGSPTPLGYVAGCTRTSTCTRAFMNRNKMPTMSIMPDAETIPEDEDYCERRDLDVQRRELVVENREPNVQRRELNVHNPNADKFKSAISNIMSQTFNKNIPTFTPYDSHLIDATESIIKQDEITTEPSDDCVCHEESNRKKRDNSDYSRCANRCNKSKDSRRDKLLYGDLYYRVLRKILKTWEQKKNTQHSGKCSCNVGF